MFHIRIDYVFVNTKLIKVYKETFVFAAFGDVYFITHQ